MTKSSFQRNMIRRTILYCFFFFIRSCSSTTRNSFEDIDLNSQTLNPVVTGFMLTGNDIGDLFGVSVKTAGDINQDGYKDFIVGASSKNSGQGAAYVFYGGEESTFLNIDLSTTSLDPLTTGFTLIGISGNNLFGFSVSTAGDIDNDGYDDIIIGAPYQNGYQGAAYVIYGGEKSSMSNWDFSSGATLTPSSTGFMITGNAGDYFGQSVSTAGDIDGDGYDDMVIGAHWSGGKGTVYVVYGGDRSTISNIILSSTPLVPASTGFVVTGNAANDLLGWSVSTAGDIDNDGYSDIIAGAWMKNSNQGAAYVIYGGDRSTISNIPLSTTTLLPGSTGFMITGNAGSTQLGYTVSIAGDINNDGYDDIIIGTFSGNIAYVIYGGDKSSMSNWDFSSAATLTPSTTGFTITGNGGYFGSSVSTVGDTNNDGYADIIIGAYGENSNQGAAYVIYGGEKSTMSDIALSSTPLDPTSTGFAIAGNPGDGLGLSVNTAGDINQDGYDDIFVSAAYRNSVQGAAYVIYASCSAHCKQCFSPSLCSECKNLYMMYQYECFASCPDTTLATSATICEDCPTRCLHCSSTYTCTECITPFVLYDTQCLTSCPITMFNSNNSCKSCPSYCYSCTSEDSCQVCFEGYILSNSLCVLPSTTSPQQKALKAVSSATQAIGSVICVGSSIMPFSSLVSKIVQNTRYLNLSVTNELAEVYETWNTDLISWSPPNVMSDMDHFETSPSLFAQYGLSSPFLVNFWPTLLNIGIGFGTFLACILLQKLLENERYEGWAFSLVKKLTAGSFNFALVQAYSCLDDVLFYLVIDAKTSPFNSFFSWASMTCAGLFLALGCLQVFFNFWTVKKYQSIKTQGTKQIETFNEKNKYWELFYSDFNDDDLWSQSFFALAIIRSALSSLIIAILSDDPLMQASYFVTIDITIISFLYIKNPFKTLRGALAQYYYESITLIVHLGAFILGLQDTFETSSDTIRNIMSTGILYLNTALISGTIGFMFLEIYKRISEKRRATRPKKRKSIPENALETQTADQLQITSIETSHLELENSRNRSLMTSDLNIESNFKNENSILSSMRPNRRTKRQRNQSPLPITIRQRPQKQQRKNHRTQKDLISYP